LLKLAATDIQTVSHDKEFRLSSITIIINDLQ